MNIALIALMLAAGGPAQRSQAPPARIVALAPSNAEIVIALGAADRLVAVSDYVKLPSRFDHLPRVGGLIDPDLESIVALEADLILMRGANAHLDALCKDRDIGIYVDRTDSLDSIYTTISELGELLGRSDRAQQLNGRIRAELDSIGKQSSRLDRPRVLLTVRGPDRLASITTVSGTSYLNSLIDIAGGQNIFADTDIAYPQVRLEEIVARAPQVIIEAMPSQGLDDAGKERIIGQWSSLTAIPAVRDGRIHIITEDFALVPSQRVTLMARRLFELIHPERVGP